MDDAIKPYTIAIPDADLTDLERRLATTRLPDPLPGTGWDYGANLEYLPELLGYWREKFDWRAQETALNRFPHFMTSIDGQRLHFIHARSSHQHALPLLMSHGWPGSIVEFMEVIEPLTQPERHGGDPADAFHVVAPSLPGFAFSGPTTEPGWDAARMASAFASLMERLGYTRYGVEGGDWGTLISTYLGARHADAVCGVHLLLALGAPPDPANPLSGLTEAERRDVAGIEVYNEAETAYFQLQSTKPHSLGVGLGDSPAGLAAWLIEKFTTWSDCDGHPENSYTKDQLLTNISVYWFTGTITSSCRIYYEVRKSGALGGFSERVEVPTGVARFPKELAGFLFPRAWVANVYHLVHWTEMPRGGHFGAMEQPKLFVENVRAFFRSLR